MCGGNEKASSVAHVAAIYLAINGLRTTSNLTVAKVAAFGSAFVFASAVALKLFDAHNSQRQPIHACRDTGLLDTSSPIMIQFSCARKKKSVALIAPRSATRQIEKASVSVVRLLTAGIALVTSRRSNHSRPRRTDPKLLVRMLPRTPTVTDATIMRLIR